MKREDYDPRWAWGVPVLFTAIGLAFWWDNPQGRGALGLWTFIGAGLWLRFCDWLKYERKGWTR